MRFRVFVFLLFTITVFAFSQEVPQEAEDWNWYQGKPIRDIVFSGLKNISSSELDAIMSTYKGRLFDDNIFWEMQGRLYALEYFDRIEPSVHRATSAGNEVIIRFSVVERPVIGRITFVGNSGLRPRELQDVLTSKVHDIYNQAKVRVDIQALINKYIEKGYPNVSITVSETQAGDSTINLVFHITENERISISRIDFQGNTRFSDRILRSQLSLKAKSLILNDGAFQESKLIADIESITKYYRDRGYIDAIVRDVTRTYDSNDRGTNLVLTFMIEEGSEFRFGGVTFEGNIIFTTEQLERLIMSRNGEIVNMTKVEMDLQRVADLYYENGYIYNSIVRTPDKNILTNTLSYTVTIVERSRAYIENIIIIGNSKTKSNVILREIPLEPGDVFSKTKIMEAMRNLYNLQYFSTIIPDTLQGSTENLMDLVFTFEEQMTSDIQFGLTFSGSADPNTFPISGLIKWTDRNVAGSGNELGAEINSSVIDSLTVSLNYLHRWAFGLPLSLGLDFSTNYSKRYATMNNSAPFFNGDEDDAFPDGFASFDEYKSNNYLPSRDYLLTYDQLYISLGIRTGYRWSTYFGIFGISGGGRAGIIRNTYNDELYRPFDPALRAGNNSWMPKNSLYLALSLDQRDIFYDPSRGYYLYNSTGFYGVLDNEREHYMKNDSKAEYFLTLFDIPVTDTWNFKSVLGIHVGLSVLFGQPGRGDPVIENANKLAVDGLFVGRGWNNKYSDKGLLLLDSWIELRFPVVRGILSFDLFFDTAGVETDQGYYFGENQYGESNFTIENMRFSFGGGFRFTIPQFPIRLSLLKRFTIVNGNVKWEPGAIFGDSNNPAMGLDLVMSFVLSY